MTKQQIVIMSVLLFALFWLVGCTFIISVEPNLQIGLHPYAPETETAPETATTPAITPTVASTTPGVFRELPTDFLGIETLPSNQNLITTTLFYSISVNTPFLGRFSRLGESPSLSGINASRDNFVLAIAHADRGEKPQSPFTATHPITWVLFLSQDEMPPMDMGTSAPVWLRFIHLDYNNVANPIGTHGIIISNTIALGADDLSTGIANLEPKLTEWAQQHSGWQLWVDFVVIEQGKNRRLFPFFPIDPIAHPVDPSGGNSVYCTQWYSCDTAQGAWSGFCHYVLHCN